MMTSSQVIQALDRMVSATCRRFCAIGSGRISRARVHADAPSSQHLAQQTKCKKRSEAGASACKRSGRATTEASALWEHIEHQAREAFVPEVPYFLQRALEYRKQQDMKHKNLLFREIVEEFIIDQAPLQLEFLSPKTKATLVKYYFTLPYHLLPQQEAQDPNFLTLTMTGSTNYVGEMLDCSPDPAILNDAIQEAIMYAACTFEKIGLTTSTLRRLQAVMMDE